MSPSHHLSASHHDAHNFNQGSLYPPSYPASPKVPPALLYPPQTAVNSQQKVTVAGGMRQSAIELAGGIRQNVPGAAAGSSAGAVGMKQGTAGTDSMKHSVAGVGGINQNMTIPGGMNQSVVGMGGMKQSMIGAGDLRPSATEVGEARHTAGSSQHHPPASPFQEPSRKINNYEGIG